MVIIKCTIPGGREQILILIKQISPPPLLAPFIPANLKFLFKERKNYKQMLMMEKSTFFQGRRENAIGSLLCKEMPGGTIYQRKYNTPRLKLMIAI